MSNSNFVQAVRELTGFNEEKKIETEEGISVGPLYEKALTKKDVPNPKKRESSSHITSTMVINGEIQSKDVLVVDGIVKGNVTTTSNIEVHNILIGDVIGENCVLGGKGKVKGNIIAKSSLEIGQECVLVGNAKADNMLIQGSMKGNIDASESVRLMSTAYVCGNVSSSKFISELGSKISGEIITKNDCKVLNRNFEFCVED